MKFYCLVFSLIALAYAKHEIYQGWKSYYLQPSTQEQVVHIRSIAAEYEVDILSHPILQREGLVLVNPRQQEAFLANLQDHGISYRIHQNDVKAALDYDDIQIEAKNNETRARNGKQIPYDNYQEWEVIDAYLDDIAARYPSTVTLVQPAVSFEGRPIKYLKISTSNFFDASKPVIFIDGGIHSREWISPPSVTWAIHKLVVDVTEPDLLQRFDWIILPVVNPDGYKFTFSSSRWWRKTRSTNQHAWSNLCPGVDGNRNYDFFWNTIGVSSSPCTDVYPGSRPFSEVETSVVRDIIAEHLRRMALYITVHSFGSMVLYPWGHDGTLSPNALNLHTVGVAMANAIERNQASHFDRYVVGNAALVLGGASGAAEDYAHLVGVPLSYTYELPGLSWTMEGFNLPVQYISRVVRETWEGFVVGARMAGDRFVPST